MNHADLTADLPLLQVMGMIDLDATAIISGGIFVVMLVLLNTLLFQPYLAIVRERDRLTAGAQSSAEDTVAKAEQVLSDYESSMRAARTEAAAIREQLRATGEEEQRRIVSSAREQAGSALAARRATLHEQVAAAEAQVDVRAAELAKNIVGRVMA